MDDGEKQRIHQAMHLCFIDYSKAFNCVDHELLWKSLLEMEIPGHFIRLLKSLYTNQEATVRTEFGNTDTFTMGKGVRQGCILSPYLFNLYAERIIRQSDIDDLDAGIRIGGRRISNLRFADDTTLLSSSLEQLREMLERVKKESEKAGLYLNIKKTKMMSNIDGAELKLNEDVVERVENFVFLGSRINMETGCRDEIKRRLAMGRAAMKGLDKIWRDKDITLLTKQRLVRILVFPIATYGCEAWTKRKSEIKIINAFEMWCWHRMMRISWTSKIKNEDIRAQLKEEATLAEKTLRQKLVYFGHVMRGNSLEKSVMTGMGEGARGRGRPRTRWMDEVTGSTKLSLGDLRTAVDDRLGWRRFVMTVTRGRIRPDSTR
jgi:hypothetical protein